MMQKSFEFQAEVRFTCPFCKGKVDASSKGENPGVLHTLPYCKEFGDMEVTEFLRAARTRMSG